MFPHRLTNFIVHTSKNRDGGLCQWFQWGGGRVDDKLGGDDERDAGEISPRPGRRLRGGKVTGRRETGRTRAGRKEMGGKTTGEKETGVGETGAKKTGD